MAPTSDRVVVLAVVLLLGAIGLLGLAGAIWLIHDGIEPNAVAVVGTASAGAVGALSALLASTRTTVAATQEAKAEGYAEAVAHVEGLGGAPQQVEVVQPAGAPVPVVETPQPPPDVDPANPRRP